MKSCNQCVGITPSECMEVSCLSITLKFRPKETVEIILEHMYQQSHKWYTTASEAYITPNCPLYFRYCHIRLSQHSQLYLWLLCHAANNNSSSHCIVWALCQHFVEWNIPSHPTPLPSTVKSSLSQSVCQQYTPGYPITFKQLSLHAH